MCFELPECVATGSAAVTVQTSNAQQLLVAQAGAGLLQHSRGAIEYKASDSVGPRELLKRYLNNLIILIFFVI